MMPSSPPTRWWRIPPQSPGGSEYSIHLSALGPESDDEASPLPQQRIDRVLSEDIDGPSDFTLNLAAYMRGELQPPPKPETSTRHLLQPTVEDCHSELNTPARLPSKQNARRPRGNSVLEEITPAKSGASTPGRPSSETISPVRSPTLQRSRPSSSSSHTLQPSSRPSSSHTQRPSSRPSSSHIQRPSSRPSSPPHTQQPSLEQELQALRERCQQAEALNTSLSRTLEEERRLRSQQAEAHKRLEEGSSGRIAELEDELKAVRAENESFRIASETENAQQRLRDQAAARKMQDELSGHIADLKYEVKAVRAEYKNFIIASETEIEHLRLADQAATREMHDGLSGRISESRDELEAVRAENQKLKVASETEIEQFRLADQAALNDAILGRDATQDLLSTAQRELELARAEVVDAKAQLSDLRAANAAVDAKVSESIRKREAYWRVRVDELEKERKLMAKELMRMWGREECGITEPQKYAYKFKAKGSVA